MHVCLSEKADKKSPCRELDVILPGLAASSGVEAQQRAPTILVVPCILFEVMKIKSLHFDRDLEQNCTRQSKFGVWLESAALCCVPSHRAVLRSVFSPLSLSHTSLLRWNKEAFHIDLETQPPPSPQEPTQRNPPQLSDINLSVPLADGLSSRLR